MNQLKKILLMVLLTVLYTFTNFEVYFNLSEKKLASQQLKWLFIDAVFAVLVLFLVYVIYKKVRKISNIISLRKKWLITIIFIIISLSINFLYSYLPETNNQQMIETIELSAPILTAFQIRLFAPVLEEFIWRGIFMNLFFVGETNLLIFSRVFFSGIIFGFLHTFNLGIDLIIYSVMGWLLASVYWFTKDIRCPIMVHLVLNNI